MKISFTLRFIFLFHNYIPQISQNNLITLLLREIKSEKKWFLIYRGVKRKFWKKSTTWKVVSNKKKNILKYVFLVYLVKSISISSSRVQNKTNLTLWRRKTRILFIAYSSNVVFICRTFGDYFILLSDFRACLIIFLSTLTAMHFLFSFSFCFFTT